MHTLARNKQTVYYALYGGKTPNVDSNGFKTGEYTITYTAPTAMQLYVSAARGNAEDEMFGINTAYQKVAITDNMACPLAEDSHLWIGVPAEVEGVVQPYNCIVVQVARSFNHISYALREVKVG